MYVCISVSHKNKLQLGAKEVEFCSITLWQVSLHHSNDYSAPFKDFTARKGTGNKTGNREEKREQDAAPCPKYTGGNTAYAYKKLLIHEIHMYIRTYNYVYVAKQRHDENK